jgi:hypothetical protein
MSFLRVIPLLLAFAALTAWSPLQAGERQQATLRISLTIVDGCDIQLPEAPEQADGNTRVECNDSVPHRLQVDAPHSRRAKAAGADGGSREVSDDIAQLETAALAGHDDVTVAVVTF